MVRSIFDRSAAATTADERARHATAIRNRRAFMGRLRVERAPTIVSGPGPAVKPLPGRLDGDRDNNRRRDVRPLEELDLLDRLRLFRPNRQVADLFAAEVEGELR